MNQKRRKAFTLVELIIVIIILGILAALAIPQFVTSTTEAQEATLKANLQVMRNAINLYYHQHRSTYPGAVKTDGTGTATVDADNPDAFVKQLTSFTNDMGKISATLDRTNYPCGPYIMTAIPASPVSRTGTSVNVVKVTNDAGAMTADGTTGWMYSKQTGQIIANETNAKYSAL